MLALLSLMTLGHAGWYDRDFNDTIQRVESMVWEGDPQAMVQRQGLSLMNVTWEDTGRYKGSVWGPNISDLTIGVRDASGALHPMPVIRYDNFNDKTADIRTSEFFVRTGNEDGRGLRNTSLKDILQDTDAYLHSASSWNASNRSLWASRDDHVLVSAQACFLPIPKSGEATFTPVIYNYQSSPGAPAVATIVATREGTSIQVVENNSGYMSDVLYFNEDGQRAPFTAMRKSDFKAQGGDKTNPGASADDPGLNVVLIIQVPLKVPQVARYYDDYSGYDMAEPMAESAPAEKSASPRRSDVEEAVVGHGETEGPYNEINGLSIERDPQFPVRVTVQFYQATSNGVVTEADIVRLKAQIDRVYSQGDYVGSLVTSGVTNRPTEWVNTPPKGREDATWANSWWGGLKNW